MAIVLRVKNSQIEPKITGLLFQNTYYVDDRMVDGLKLGFFTHITGEGKSIGEAAPTLVHANAAAGRKADGIVYDASKRSEYTSANNWNSNTRLFPYGMRQDTAIGLLKYGVIEISDSENTKHRQFASITEENVPMSELKLLQKFEEGGVIKFVSNIAADGAVTAILADGTAPATKSLAEAKTTMVKRLCQMGDTVYLAGWTEDTTPGATNAMAVALPFVTWNTGQAVGYIEAPTFVRIDLRPGFVAPIVLDTAAPKLEISEEQYSYELAHAEHKFVRDETPLWLKGVSQTAVMVAKAVAKVVTPEKKENKK